MESDYIEVTASEWLQMVDAVLQLFSSFGLDQNTDDSDKRLKRLHLRLYAPSDGKQNISFREF